MVSRFAEVISPEYTRIGNTIAASKVAHFDETGTRVAGKTVWVHTASTEAATFLYLGPTRGNKGMDIGGILPRFHGTAVHDCWLPYWKYDCNTTTNDPYLMNYNEQSRVFIAENRNRFYALILGQKVQNKQPVRCSVIASITTDSGLCIKCGVDKHPFISGIKISDEELLTLNMVKTSFHGDWNYMVYPRP